MAIKNIIQKAEKQFPVDQNITDAINNAVSQISGISGVTVLPDTLVYTTGDQTISGNKTFTAERYVFSGANVVFVDNTGIVSGNWQFINNTNFSGTLNFNTANTGEVLDGQMNWNNDYGTLQIGMDNGNVINPVGFKSFYRVKAAENIRKGKVVMALGGVGNSEYILAREAQNIGNSGQLIMGVSAEEILANNFGDVVAFGAVRGVNTSSYPVDSILYFDTASTGEFTNIPPQAPNPRIIVALNTTSTSNGIIFIRVGPDTSNFANLVHTHVVADVSGLGTAATRNVGAASNEVSPGNHTHIASNITDSTSAGRTLLTSNSQGQRESLSIIVTSNNFASLPAIGSIQRLYITADNWKAYGWVPVVNQYLEISPTQTGELDNRYTQNLGNVSGIRAMTTGEYNSITPISGVVYILT